MRHPEGYLEDGFEHRVLGVDPRIRKMGQWWEEGEVYTPALVLSGVRNGPGWEKSLLIHTELVEHTRTHTEIRGFCCFSLILHWPLFLLLHSGLFISLQQSVTTCLKRVGHLPTSDTNHTPWVPCSGPLPAAGRWINVLFVSSPEGLPPPTPLNLHSSLISVVCVCWWMWAWKI